MRLLAILLFSAMAFGQGTVMPILGTTAPGSSGPATITFVKDCGGANAISGSDSISGCNFTNGDTIFVAINEFNTNSSNHISSIGGTGLSCGTVDYTNYEGPNLNGNTYWYHCTVSAGATAVAVVYTTSINHGIGAVEFSGSAPFVFDAGATYLKNAGTNTWITSNLSPLASKTELVLGFTFNYSNNTAPVAAGGYTSFGSAGGGGNGGSVGGYKIVSSTTGTYNPTGTVGGGGVNFATSGVTYRVN